MAEIQLAKSHDREFHNLNNPIKERYLFKDPDVRSFEDPYYIHKQKEIEKEFSRINGSNDFTRPKCENGCYDGKHHMMIRPGGIDRREAEDYCKDYSGIPSFEELQNTSAYDLDTNEYSWHASMPAGTRYDDRTYGILHIGDEYHQEFEVYVSDDPSWMQQGRKGKAYAVVCREEQ